MGLHTTTLYGDVAFLPLQAQAPLSEVLEWRTEIQTSRDGTDIAKRLRSCPRQRIAASFPVPPAQAARAVNIVYGARTLTWAVPLWQDAQAVGAVSSGASEVLCDPSEVDLRASSLALLWEGPAAYEVVEVDTVASDRVALLATVSGTYTGATLVPLRVGKVLTDPTRETTGYNGAVRLSFSVTDNVAYTPAAPDQFLSEDVYFDPHLLPGAKIGDTYTVLQETVDQDTGIFDVVTPWTYPRVVRPYAVVCVDRSEAWAFRQWLHRRAGRHRPFWTPTFEPDLAPSGSGSITTTLVVLDEDFDTFSAGRLHIAVEDTDGNWYPRTVSGFTPGAGTVSLTLSSSLGIAYSDIARISYLGRKRLDTDRIEMRWAGNGVCLASVRIAELEP